MRSTFRFFALALLIASPVAVVACGDEEPPPGLSAAELEGRDIANSRGCSGCHGSNGEGGTGPAFEGLAGSTVELEGGDSVTADDDYLFQAIEDPGSQRVKGYKIQMPNNSLTDAEIEKVITYINGLK